MTYELTARDPRLVDNVPQRWAVRVPALYGYPDGMVAEAEFEQMTLMEATVSAMWFAAEGAGNRQAFFGPVA